MLYPSFLLTDVRRRIWYVLIALYLFLAHCSLPHTHTGKLDVNSFADRLWGDIYFNPESRKFTRKPADPEMARSFVYFVLEPLYKLYSQVLSEETESLKSTLAGLGIKLKPVMYKMDVRPLLKAILDQFFGPSTGLVDVIAEHIPSPVVASASKVSLFIFSPFETPIDDSLVGRRNIQWTSNI